MHPTVPGVQSTHGSRRNRVVLLAVLPFMLIAMGASVFWVVLIGRVALGAVALFFPVAIVVIPAALGMAGLLLGGAGAGLASLGAMLWSGSSLRRWGLAAPALVLGLGFVAGTPFLHDSLAAQLADGFGVAWLAWALVAQLVFPAVVAVMALCVLWPGKSPSRLSTGVAWLGLGVAWAALVYGMDPALGMARDSLQRRAVEQVDEIASDNRNPIVVAVCNGQLAKAAGLIQTQAEELNEGAIDSIQSNCLRKSATLFYAERVGVALDATLAWEARAGKAANETDKGCTKHQVSLLRIVYANDFPEAALQAFRVRGLPIACPAEASGGRPVWWEIASSHHRPEVQTLQRLQGHGIDLHEVNREGLTLVGENPNGFIANLSDASLLGMAELGLKDQSGGRSPHALVIEVMKRRHGLGRNVAASPELARAHALLGEPSDEQLREVMARAPWMLRAYSDAQREQEQQLREAIAQRLRAK